MRLSSWRGFRRLGVCPVNISVAVCNFYLLLISTCCISAEDPLEFPQESSHLLLKLRERNDTFAAEYAASHGFRLKRAVPFLDTVYFMEENDSVDPAGAHRRRKRSPEFLGAMRDNSPLVSDVFEDYPRVRRKRDYVDEPPPLDGASTGGVTALRSRRQTFPDAMHQSSLPIPRLPFPDPLYKDQWYLVGRAEGGFDMNVREAWMMGYAGRGVSISILDDGIQRDHPDLIANYDPLASTDINDHDDDPTPQNNGDNKHGTRCAGEVAAAAGNNVCGVGVAFHAKIGGVRMLDGPVSDSVEAASLSLNQHHIDIYSASWGPEDDGKTFDGPGNLAQEAFYRGVKMGRGGKGNIFVWASGNGGSRQDSCSADGYTTSIYTLSISSATYDNHRPWYLEECPSTIASTYSSANLNQPAIVTVDVPNGCTKTHTGTSASAPLAAGIIALALEANPSLTWRDTQHVVLRTANPRPLINNPGWSKNGVGRLISNKFGYGLMDAGAIVKLAKTWSTVPEQHMCTYEYSLDPPRPRQLVGNFQLNFSIEVNGCERGTPVLYLEHVQVVTTIRYAKRGDLRLTLFSPSGTRSVLLPPRPQDVNPNGFHKWPFLSVQMWGEDPRGIWTLMIESVTTNPNIGGIFSDWSLLLYGTEDPAQPTDQRYPHMAPSSRLPNAAHSFIPQDVPVTETSDWPLSFGDLRSVGDCHEECVGCTESRSASACLSCKHFTQTLRNRAGYKCVSHCNDGFYADADRCKKCSVNCASCTSAETCDTCHGAKLLIDTNDHFGHFDNGRCVDQCPIGLVSDYTTNLLQARCVIKKNSCSAGYFENMLGTCVECDSACAICHGAGTLQCDECAPGYGNRTLGFCRPCCTTPQYSNVTTASPPSAWAHGGISGECEDCSADYKGPTHRPLVFASDGSYVSGFGRYGDDNYGDSSTAWRFFLSLVLIFLGAFACCVCAQMLCVRWNNGDGLLGAWAAATTGGDSRLNMEYTPLKNADDDLERHGVVTRPLAGRSNEDVESGMADTSPGRHSSLKMAYGSDTSESDVDDISPIH